jgi:hypothetical protein
LQTRGLISKSVKRQLFLRVLEPWFDKTWRPGEIEQVK